MECIINTTIKDAHQQRKGRLSLSRVAAYIRLKLGVSISEVAITDRLRRMGLSVPDLQ